MKRNKDKEIKERKNKTTERKKEIKD